MKNSLQSTILVKNNNMKDRIRQIMESQHMTQQVFANYIGTSAASLSSIFNDRTRPTLNIVEAIKNKIPNINLNWLMFGIGDMYEGDGTFSGNQNNDKQEQLLDFGDSSSAQTVVVQDRNNQQNVQRASNNVIRTDVKYIDKPQRQITEIRVFFDDLTYESFVPKK